MVEKAVWILCREKNHANKIGVRHTKNVLRLLVKDIEPNRLKTNILGTLKKTSPTLTSKSYGSDFSTQICGKDEPNVSCSNKTRCTGVLDFK